MARGLAFLLVGHENWGKSRTLRAMTSGGLTRSTRIGGHRISIKRMSNDDDLEGYEKYITGLSPTASPLVIVPFCPKVVAPDTSAVKLLKIIISKYDVFFLVLRHSFSDSRVVTTAQEDYLRTAGVVQVLPQREGAARRAAEFRQFIERQLP